MISRIVFKSRKSVHVNHCFISLNLLVAFCQYLNLATPPFCYVWFESGLL